MRIREEMDMKIKIKFSILIIILILNTLIVGCDFGFIIKNSECELNNTSISRSDNRLRGENNHWGQIEVVSEPVPYQEWNLGISRAPKVSVEDNKIYLVWVDYTNFNGAGGDSDIFYRFFNGSEWSNIEVISEPISGYDNNIEYSLSPDIAVEDGKIYVVWKDENNTNGAGNDWDIFYRCNLTGSGWEDIQIISDPYGINDFFYDSWDPEITVENGKIYVIWPDEYDFNNAGTDMDIFFRTNLTGSNWEEVQVLSEPVYNKNFNTESSGAPTIAVENGKIYVAWSDLNDTNGAGNTNWDYDIFYRCNRTGTSWEDTQVISEPVHGNDININRSVSPSIAVDNNKIYVVWRDENNTNGAGNDWDIFYRSNLTGTDWEAIQVISEPIPGKNINTGPSYDPAIVAKNNKIYVVWGDFNNTNGAGSDGETFYKCNLTGYNWEAEKAISEPVPGNNFNNDYSGYPDISVDLGKIYVVWEDITNMYNAGTDFDIFFRSTKVLPPILSFPSVTPTLGNTSTYFNFTVKYIDKDNDAPTEINVNISSMNYSMMEVDPGDTNHCDGKNYYYNITHLDFGMHTYKFWTSDGTYINFTELFNGPYVYNTVPKIITEDNLTAIEDTYYEVIYEYEDMDVANVGQLCNWQFSTNAEWLAFNTNTAVVYGTPTNDDVGKYWVNIEINDTVDEDHTNFTLTVVNINDNPIIDTNNLEIAYEDELYEVDYYATDVDSLIENQIWSLSTNASSWLNIDSDEGILSGTPTNDEVGFYWVNVSVDDSDGGLDFTNFTLTVHNVNDRPEITTEDILTAIEGKLYEVDYNATDIDNLVSQQTWSLNTNASWLTISSTTGVLIGTPTSFDLDWYNVNITVDDGDGGQDWHEFILTILKGNKPPLITTMDVVSATANKLYYVDYEAIDDYTPLDELIWSIETNANWLKIETNTGILSGTPKLSDVGWYWVNVFVYDDESEFDFHNFTLTVYSTPNQPPEIITEDSHWAKVDVIYIIDYEATDDRTPINYLQWQLTTNASWLSIDSSTGLLSGIPAIENVGNYWINVSVWDGEDGWDYHNFTLRVSKEPIIENNAPELSNPKMTPSQGDIGTEFTFSIHYYDEDGDIPISINVWIDGEEQDMILKDGENAADGIYEFNTKLTEGEHIYYFTAYDGLETVRADDFTTPKIKKVIDERSQEKFAWDWLILIVILVIIIILILLDIIIRFKKAEKKKSEKDQLEPTLQEVGIKAPVEEEPAFSAIPQEPIVAAPTRSSASITSSPQPVLVPTITFQPKIVMPQILPKVVQQSPQLKLKKNEAQYLEDEEELEE